MKLVCFLSDRLFFFYVYSLHFMLILIFIRFFFFFIVYCGCFLKFQFKLNKCEYVRSCVCLCLWECGKLAEYVCNGECVCACVLMCWCVWLRPQSLYKLQKRSIDRSGKLAARFTICLTIYLSLTHTLACYLVSCFSFATL